MADLNPADLRGKKLVDPRGGEIGEVQEVYSDRETDKPEFVLVNTGLFGRKSTFVPLTGASLDGPRIWVDVEKGQIDDAPKVDPEEDLSPEQEAAIYRHYGVSPSAAQSNDAEGNEHEGPPGTGDMGGVAGEATGSRETSPASEEPATSEAAPREQDTTAESARPSSTRTPEAGGERGSEAGLPRLRRYVVTEEVEIKVPVQREEVRVESPETRSEEARSDRPGV